MDVRTYKWTLAACGMTALAGSGYWSVRISLADWLAGRDTSEALSDAARLAPGNAEYRLRLAELLEEEGRPAKGVLGSASEMNPSSAGPWIHLGLLAELEGDHQTAEDHLLQAARASAQYEPRWSLANFYFRNGQGEPFWRWARAALAVSYGDRRPIFELCWRVSQDAGEILQRALPDRTAVWRDYATYLATTGRLEAIPVVAAQLIKDAEPKDVDLLLGLTNVLLQARHWEAAMAVWNGLCARKLLAHDELAIGRRPGLTNGDFRTAFVAGGFDWRVPPISGIAGVRGNGTFLTSFSGKQPEQCEAVWQYVVLEPMRRYGLQFAYRTDGIEPHTGLSWRLVDVADGRDLRAYSPHLSSAAWKRERAVFVGGESTRLARLVLGYRRPAGMVRVEGTLTIRELQWELQP